MSQINIVPYVEKYFPAIQELNEKEGWTQLVERSKETKQAWLNSNVAYVVLDNHDEVQGYIRGLSDGNVTTYICEVLISENVRGQGIGATLLKHVHDQFPKTRMEMLASSTSESYYKHQNFRPFYGFRKTYEENV